MRASARMHRMTCIDFDASVGTNNKAGLLGL